jgi:antitoxin component YwqK of YwqJK toxin-antitoxin module
MKNKICFLLVFVMFISCSLFKKEYAPSPKGSYDNNVENYKYIDFPNEDRWLGDSFTEDHFQEGGIRYGKIVDGYKEGKWLSGNADFDKSGKVYAKGGIWREEYFKKGLRDSIFKQFDNDGKLIYETTFKMGTGLWKEYHNNGKIYFEIATKDGYFTDTLKLFTNKGRLQKKLLYKKDSLVYSQKYNPNIADTIENGKKVKIIYENNKIERKEFVNGIWWYEDGKVYLKSKDTIINGIKKSYQEYTNGDDVTKSVYIKNNPIIEYESIFRFSKNILTSQLIVLVDKVGNPQETETKYDEKGKLKSITYRRHKAYLYNKENNIQEKTDYYQSGKKYECSELIYKENKIIKRIGGYNEHIQFKELNYYNLKKELIKKEYIKNTSGETNGGHGEPISYQIIEKNKTEYFEKNKLVKTEYFEKNKLIKTEEN